MMSATETVPYVSCDQFCGKPIRNGNDHDPDCAAPLAERKRIADEVKRLRFEAADIEVEVDGEKATLHQDPPRAEQKPIPEWRDPQVLDRQVYAAQKAIDDEDQIVGGMGSASKCPGKEMVDGVELDCPHLTMVKGIEVRECSEGTKHRKKIWQMCLIHTILALSDGIAPAGLGPLFADLAE